jgi:phosphodiesterase/alkaline phosphatase D-like protein
MATDDERYFVNRDVTGLKPGMTVHYRLVAENKGGTRRGPGRTCTVPRDQKPIVRTDPAVRITPTSAQVRGRLNPLGLRTKFHFEYGTDESYGLRTSPVYGGLEITPRLAFANLGGLKAATRYHYRLVAVNEQGTSVGADAVFQTRP